MNLRYNQSTLIAAAVGVMAVIIVLGNSLFVVSQTDQALILQLGRPVRTLNTGAENNAGLQLKWPFLEKVVKFDKRSIAVEQSREEVQSSSQELLVVDAFLRYKITDPVAFYQAVADEAGARDRLERLVASSLRQALGSATPEEIISTNRAELMKQVRDDVDRRVEASRYGIQIVDLRIKRTDLPQANQNAVYTRMQTQREQEAAETRAKGDQQATEIRANAQKQAETTRGEGDAEAARVFAESFGKDANFAAFYRSMSAYRAALAQGDATMVLSPDSEFFRYFKSGPGGN